MFELLTPIEATLRTLTPRTEKHRPPDDFHGDDSEGGGADVGREEEAHG